jgi:hypothetical protein
MPVHSHAGATTYADTNHFHYYSGSTGWISSDHAHAPYASYQYLQYGANWNNWWIASGGQGIDLAGTTAGVNANHYHDYSGNTGWQSDAYNNSNHNHGVYNDGGGAAHNNMPPWIAVAQIIKVQGVTIESGSVLVGPQGSRGATWFVYEGSGTPVTGQFIGEIDGDMAIRQVDGTIFKRVSGQWVDQSFTVFNTAATTAARAWCNTAMTTNSWTIIPLSSLQYDKSNNLYDPTNGGQFRAPVDGQYQVNAAIGWGASSWTGVCICAVQSTRAKYGQEYLRGNQLYTGGNGQDLRILGYSDVLDMQAGDTLQLLGYSEVNYSVNAGVTTTYMSVALITAGPGPKGQNGAPGIAGPYEVQRMLGTATSYGTYSANSNIDNGSGSPMSIVVTPDVDSWWEVNAHIGLVQKADANYNYAYFLIQLNPADMDGLSQAYVIKTQHQSVQTYDHYTWHRIFRLAEGVTYNANLVIQPQGGTWQVYQDNARLAIEGKMWAQGVIEPPEPTPELPPVAIDAGQVTGPFPRAWSFEVPYECDILVEMLATCSGAANQQAGLQPRIDGVNMDNRGMLFFSSTGHQSVSTKNTVRGVQPGTHVLDCVTANPASSSDLNDMCSWGVTMTPVTT